MEPRKQKDKTQKQDKPDYLGHRQRLRERFSQAGAKGFHDYELLELLLTYSIPQKDVKPVAKELIKRFGSLGGVLDATKEELLDTPGVTLYSAVLIKLAKEMSESYLAEGMQHKDLLKSPQAVVDFARMKLAGKANESFMVIYLNTKNEAIDHEVIHEGTIDKAAIYPRRIVEAALAHNTAGLILVHNHPSGYTEPSEEDKRITQIIVEATRAIDVQVIDHIIVGKSGYFSFTEHRLLTNSSSKI
jgi:DNA repair protein RadC